MGAIVRVFEDVARKVGFALGVGAHTGHDGNERFEYFGIGGSIWTKGGHDTVTGALGYVNIHDSWGDLNVYGAFGYMSAKKSEGGDINVGAAVAYADISHLGWNGDVNVWGATGGAKILRRGESGNVKFSGLTGDTDIENSVRNHGDISFSGVGAKVHLERRQGDSGDVSFWGTAAYANLKSSVKRGNINIGGAAARFDALHNGIIGDINIHAAASVISIHHYAYQGNVNYYGAGFSNKIIRKGNSGDVNYFGCGSYNTIQHEVNDGHVNFYGAGLSNVITSSINGKGGVTFHGAGGANVISVSGRGEGAVNFYGAGFANIITHTARHGDVNFYGAGGLNKITRSGLSGNVIFKGAGAGNIVTMSVKNGDLEVYSVGAANVFTRTGAGGTNAYMAGYGNILVNNGSGFTSAKLYGAYNLVTAGNGGSAIESYGIGATIITGKGVDNIKSYGLKAIVRSGGAPDGKQDVVEVYGAFTYIDISGGRHDNGARGKVSAEKTFEQVKSFAPVKNALLDVGSSTPESGVNHNSISISTADSAAMKKYGIRDEAPSAIKASGFNKLSLDRDVVADGTNKLPEMLVQESLSFDESHPDAANVPNADSYKKYLTKDSAGRYSAAGSNKASAKSIEEKTNGGPYTEAPKSGGGDLQSKAKEVLGPEQTEVKRPDADASIDLSITRAMVLQEDRVNLLGMAAIARTGNGNDYVKVMSLYTEVHTNGGDDWVLALGAINNINTGSGNDTAIIFGLGNYVDMGSGDDLAVMLNPLGLVVPVPSVNVAQMGGGNDVVLALSQFNIVLKDGDGALNAFLFGVGNVLLQRGGKRGDRMIALMAGGLNVAHKEGDGDLIAITLGLGNSVSQKGDGNFMAIMGGKLNNVTHIGSGNYQAYMYSTYGISTKVGNGFSRVVMGGTYNVHTGVGNGDAQLYMGGIANIATKVGDGNVIGVMGGGQNVLTIVGNGSLEGVFIAGSNIVTKSGDGDATVIMAANLNFFNSVGRGNLTAITIGQCNTITKVGDGNVYLLSIAVPLNALPQVPIQPSANIFTQTGDGNVSGLLIAVAKNIAGNIVTKVGDGDIVMTLISGSPVSKSSSTNPGSTSLSLNTVTQIGNGRTAVLMCGDLNNFTKVGGGDYAYGWGNSADSKINSMMNSANSSVANAVNSTIRTIATDHSPIRLLSTPNFHTIMGALGSVNIMSEVNLKKATNTIMAGVGGYGNVMVKVGDGDFYGIAVADPKKIGEYFHKLPELIGLKESISKISSGNIIVHVGNGDTNAIAIGDLNLMIKVGDGGSKAIVIGDNNIFVRVGDAAETRMAVDIGGYRAFEGAQMVIGDRNFVVNQGKSNDIIVALDPNMLSNIEAWKKIAESMNPFPSYFQSDEDGKEIKDIYGRKYNSKTDPVGYSKVNASFFSPSDIKAIFTDKSIFSDLKKQLEDDKKKAIEKGIQTPDLYGNLVYGGEGSDFVLAIGTNNIVFSDSWTSIGDFNMEMLFDAGGTNKTLAALGSKHGTFVSMLGSRSTGLGSIPVVGPILSKLGVKASFDWARRVEIGSLIGLEGDAGGVPQFDESDIGRNWTNFALGGPQMILETPPIWTSFFGLLKNMDKFTNGEDLAHKGEGYKSEQEDEVVKGWKSGINEFISVIGVPELLSSIKVRDADGRNIWQNFFDPNTTIGWGSIWKNPDSFWSGVNLLQKNSDIVAAIGMNNVVFTGEGGDVVLALGSYNSIALGEGRDISVSWGEDNRVNGGKDNDFLIGIGASNLQIGGAGNDLVVAIGEKNRLTGDAGDDMIISFGTANVILAGTGDDFVVAVGEANVIYAGGGNDLIIAIGANNTYNMGGGNDVIINLGFASQSYYGEGTDIAYALGIGEFLDGEEGSDVFYSDRQGQGNLISGSAGDDTFYLGGRDNEFNGGADNDTFVIRDTIERVTVKDLTSADRIVIDASVKVNDIWLSRKGTDLLMEIDLWDRARDSSAPEFAVGEINFKGWFSSSSNRSKLYFEHEKTPSGKAVPTAKVLRADELNALVDAMAGFTRADAVGGFRDNMDIAAQRSVDSFWTAASKTDSFSVATA